MNHSTKRRFILAALLLAAGFAKGQVVIPAGTQIALGGNAEVLIRTSGNVVNNSGVDFSNAQLTLILNGSNQSVTGMAPRGVALTASGNQVVNADISCVNLAVAGGGQKNFNGNLTISGEIHLVNGILIPGSTSKILFTGSPERIQEANANSYVDGIFYNAGTGVLNFPIGTSGLGFAPVQLESGSGDEIGIKAVSGNPGLAPSAQDPELVHIESSHFWQLYYEPTAAFNSQIMLPLLNTVSQDLSPVVVSADGTGSEAINLGGTLPNDKSVTSVSKVIGHIVTVGGSTTVDINIHDMITPFAVDGYNDELFIENISKYPVNKVTLLDRYGVLVKEWTNFTNYSDSIKPNSEPFNFASLGVGNYMCVVEYGGEGQARKKKSQMVTVLKVD